MRSNHHTSHGLAARRRWWLPLAGFGVTSLVALALSACGGGGATSTTATTSASGSSASSANATASASQSQPAQSQPAAQVSGSESVKLVIKSDEEHGKKGSDGQWHDAYLPADFSVEAGDTVHVTVYNYDDMPHSFTAPGLKVNEEVAAGSEEKPSKTTFTFQAPQKAGSYEWLCALPCDPWAMSHDGFMKGHVTVT